MRRWTPEEDRKLLWWWAKNPRRIARELKRTRYACARRLYRLTGSSSACRGRYSLRMIARLSGYATPQLRRGLIELRLHTGRETPRSPYRLTEEQMASLVAWCERTVRTVEEQAVINGQANALAPGQWSRDWDCCQSCARTCIRHAAGGLCASCYIREARHRERGTSEP